MDVGKMNSGVEKSIRLTGTQINYYFHCRRQLWYFTHDIRMEPHSDTVFQGKLLHEASYEREKKEIEINNIKLDFLIFVRVCCTKLKNHLHFHMRMSGRFYIICMY